MRLEILASLAGQPAALLFSGVWAKTSKGAPVEHGGCDMKRNFPPNPSSPRWIFLGVAVFWGLVFYLVVSVYSHGR